MPMLLSWTWPVPRGEFWIFTDKVVNLWASSEYRHVRGCHSRLSSHAKDPISPMLRQ
ncbi:hypothetical protein M378DRAFT_168106 [Amanita muscaria Koide BX008]|uniref:Uncharacterized protein n=1 Tax=Amanita muscaria (strain Koide BX008) TaxID=946122 RepID=A0A0C2WGG0_AMAMK|nr:hypothetical protein M378DRAFT_168106 [Amanita muscaria Koide BX008]